MKHIALTLIFPFLTLPLIAQEAPSMNPGAAAPAGNSFADLGQERPAGAETVITSLEEATFDNRTGIAEFVGSVVVKDPQFTLTCYRLKAFLNTDRKGLDRVEAEGNVVIRQENEDERGSNVVSVARSQRAIFKPDTGDIDLTGWPQVQQGINAHVATEEGTKMILNRAGKINTSGSSKTVIVDTGGAR